MGQASPPSRVVVERTFHIGGVMPKRVVQTRTSLDDREILVETEEIPNLDGKFQPIQEIATVTVRVGTSATEATSDVFWFDGQRHRRLLKRIRFEEEPQADGITRRVATTWTAGLDGQLQLASREIETTRSTASDSLRQETTRFVAGINRRMEEAERTEYEERTLPTGLVEFKSAWLQRDVNGRWRAIETRKGRFHQAGVSTGVDEGRLYWRDADGNLALRERTSTRRSEVDGNEQVEIEIYSEDPVRFAGDTRLRLGERVRRTTTVGSDGHTRIVEDVEARNPVAPADALRVVRQTVTTVRDEGNHRITERRVFERDPNGRLVPFVTDVEEEVR